MSRVPIVAIVTAALLLTGAGSARAQVDELSQPAPALAVNGLSVGRLTGGEIFTAAFRWTRIRPSGIGFDGSVTTAPQAFAIGAVAVAVHGGPAVSIPFEGGALIAKGGVGPVVVASESAGAFLTGYYGLGLVVGRPGSLGLRVDWTRLHFLSDDTDSFAALELGFVKSVG